MSANRLLSQSARTIELNFALIFGAAGVVAGIVPIDNDGFDGTTPITSSGSGVYVMKLARGAQRLMPGTSIQNKQAAAYSAAQATHGVHIVDNVAGATPTITFTIVNEAGTAIQPAVGDKLHFHCVIKR
jgi:hypothetical protein